MGEINIQDFIKRVINTVPGFTGPDELLSLFCLVFAKARHNGQIVEIGSWCGRSSIVISLAARMGGHIGFIHCVDLFPELSDWKQRADGKWEIDTAFAKAYTKTHAIYKDTFDNRFKPAYDKSRSLLDLFLYYTGLFDCDNIKYHRGTIDTFLKRVEPTQIKFSFIDGDHDYSSIKHDISSVSQRMRSHDIVCIDDVGGAFVEVTKAVEGTITASEFSGQSMLTRKLFAAYKK